MRWTGPCWPAWIRLANNDIRGVVRIPADTKPGRHVLYAMHEDEQGKPTRFPGRAALVVSGPGGAPLGVADELALEARPVGVLERDSVSQGNLLLVAVATASAGSLLAGIVLVVNGRRRNAEAPVVMKRLALGLLLGRDPRRTAGRRNPPRRRHRRPPRITQAVKATGADLNPSKVYASPVVIVDPRDSRTLVAVAAEIRSRTCGLLRSTDAGQTWVRPEGTPMPDSFPFCFQTETGPAAGRYRLRAERHAVLRLRRMGHRGHPQRLADRYRRWLAGERQRGPVTLGRPR